MTTQTQEQIGHTPGPWIYEDEEVRGIGGAIVAEVFGVKKIGERRENGRLIASAPALLAACRTAYEHLMRHRFNPGGREVAEALNAALVKAEAGR